MQFISFGAPQANPQSKPKPPQINNLFNNVVTNTATAVPKPVKLDNCRGSQSSYSKADGLSSDEEDVEDSESEDADDMSQSASSSPNKKSIASFQNQMVVRQERR